ncbi:MAG TPA: hypothetical protein VEU76_06395 [Candidatus Udaeobacter sp.]|nr:hypothetical protein [Candidatus Udaeobacter sp.]
MSFPLFDLVKDLAIARGGRGPESDVDPSYLRGRIATVLWLPGAFLCVVLGYATHSAAVGIAAFVVMFVGLVVFVFRPPWLTAWIGRLTRGRA